MNKALLAVAALASVSVFGADAVRSENLRIRDPFVVADAESGVYRLYSSVYAKPGEKSDGFGNTGFGVEMYAGRDLKTWSRPVTVLALPKDFGCTAVWAPEVHAYRGKWYLFATLTFGRTILPAANGWRRHEKRGTWIFAADRPEGPYRIVKRDSVTPAGWSSLDGTLVVEDGRPYMVFCHEWTQITDGEMCLMPLKDDLSDAAGEPVTLFKASAAPDVAPNCLVTDGPFFCRDPKSGALTMIWSTIRKNGAYCVYQVKSETGRLAGPWGKHELLVGDNGGHGMLFRAIGSGAPVLSLHRPNGPFGAERMAFSELSLENGRLSIKDPYPWCHCGVAPERADDFYWENDRVGFRAYGPGDVHKWSGVDVFNKSCATNVVRYWLRDNKDGKWGNWHLNRGLGMDDYAVGPGRGVGGVVRRRNGTWLPDHGNWAASRILVNDGANCAFELDYRLPEGGVMTVAIALEKGSSFFREAIRFSPDAKLDGVEVGVGLDLNADRRHAGAVEIDPKAMSVSLFENPYGKPGEEGSLMSALVAAPGQDLVFADEPNGAKSLLTKPLAASDAGREVLVVYAGADWTEAGRHRDAASWQVAVRRFADRLLAETPASAAFKPLAPHPRLFADAAEFEALKRKLETTELGRLGRARLLKEAEALLPLPLLERKQEGRRLLAVSRNALNRIAKLAMAYRVTGERRYAGKAVRDAVAVSRFSDWNPSHFLDVGEMTLAVALARDWLDDVLSDGEKRLLEDAILRKGLVDADGRLFWDWWVRGGNNWNQVCHGGLAAGALAIRDRHPAAADAVLLRARRCLPYALKAYAGGNFPEGPAAYWEYASDYTCLALDVLGRAFRDVGELRDFPGLAEQVDYVNDMTAPSGTFFNYSDAGATSVAVRRLMYAPWALARAYGRMDALARHDAAHFRAACADADAGGDSYRSFNRLFPFVLLALPESDLPATRAATRPATLCRAFGGANPVAVLRTGTGRNDWYVGVKGGCPGTSHGHMDVGSFVLEANGVRWSCELGCEPYHRIEALKTVDLWNMSQDSSRWNLFRLGVEGHGTLAVDGARQLVRGNAPVAVSSAIAPGEAVVDMSSLYADAAEVTRSFRLEAGGGLRVADHVRGLKPGARVTWNMNTAAAAKAEGNVLVLTAKDASGDARTMTLTASPADVRWEIVDLSKPRTPADSPNPGVSRVRFARTAPADGVLDFAVVFASR